MGWRYLLGWFILGLGIGANAMHSIMEGTVCKSCPSGWTWYNGRCYVYVSSQMDWADAEKYCNSMDGNLASLRTTNEYNFIRNLIYTSSGSDTKCWVGGCDAVQNQVWFWSDGSQFDFTSWGRGEPNNYGGNEHCMDMNLNGNDYVNDDNCSKTMPFVCAKDL